jgi:hypothetical protein
MKGQLAGKRFSSIYSCEYGGIGITTDGIAFGWGTLTCFDAPQLTPTVINTFNQPVKYATCTDATSVNIVIQNGTLLEYRNGKALRSILSPVIAQSIITGVYSLGLGGLYVTTQDDRKIFYTNVQIRNYFNVVAILNTKFVGELNTALFGKFAFSDIVRIFLRNEDKLAIVTKDGQVFETSQTGWVPYIIDANSKVVGGTGRAMITDTGIIRTSSIDFGSDSVFDKTELRRVLSLTSTFLGVTGSFAKCSPHFSGKDCTTPTCNGTSDPTIACSGFGTCIAPNKCVCQDETFVGDNCEARNCGAWKTGKTCNDYSAASIIFIVFGVLAAVASIILVITALILCLFRYRKVVVKQEKAEQEMQNLLHESLLRADSLAEQVDRDWVIPFSELEFSERVSEGAFGVVMRGRYKGSDVYVDERY